jgi:adenosylcobalamin-dependent ribonucleoside-triphosphate reductase
VSAFVDSISEDFVRKYKNKVPPFGPVGLVTYKRTYARRVSGENRTEEWRETVQRCCNGILAIGGKFTKDEIETLYDKVFNLKCSFSGRALWQLGTDTVKKLGGDSLQNCWVVACSNPVESFCFAFNELMLGGGVGFNIQRETVYEMPKVQFNTDIVRRDEKDVDFIVPDNREGWVELLRRVLSSFFFTGKSFSYSTICVRGKGSLIRGFGGVASGPEDLCRGIESIIGVLKQRIGKKLRPIDCLDIMNLVGSVVVAGNVRRSAQLALGDMDDFQYLDAKNWSKGPVPNWRAMSNNSVVCNDFEHLPQKFWSGYNGDGEAYGLINLSNCRRYGRLIDGTGYRPDPHVIATNPCGEIPLASAADGSAGESCNLSEIFLPNLKDEEEFRQVACLMYKVTKTISCLPYIHEGTNKIVKENHRLGNGVTGFLQAPHLRDEKIFDSVYKSMEKLDKEYSKILGVDQSIKLCTCKPSGTLSLLPGVTPGVHPAYAPCYIRRIRMASGDGLVQVCQDHGYHVEPVRNFDGTQNWDTMVVSFPIKIPVGTLCAKDVSAVQQLDHAKWLQTHWSDNSVSVTVYYRKEELPAIKEWLRANYDKSVKTVSFLLHQDHGFAQAPYEEITEAQYEGMSKDCKPITKIGNDAGGMLKDSLECATGACPVK